MSADSFAEPGGAAGGIALRTPPGTSMTGSGHPASSRPWNGHERRSADRVKRLSREFDALCTSAVDAAEITAGLESAGFTDRSAREYGFANMFTLAESLFQLAPRLDNQRPGRLANPWAERPLRHLVRGVCFALPGLVFVACLPRATSSRDFAALTVAMLFGWPAGQTMAFLGYALEGRRHPMAARAMLMLGLCTSLLLALGFGLVARSVGGSPTIVALGAGEIAYVAAAAVLLVLGHELAVLASLVPGLAAAGLSLWDPGIPQEFVAAGAATSVALAVLAAVVAGAGARLRDLRVGFETLTRHDGVEVCFHIAYGVTGGVLVTLPTLAGLGTAATSLSLLPVIWSMGAAEWNIVRLRRRSFDLLNEAISVPFFQGSVRRLAASSVVRYLNQLSVLTLILVAGARWASAGPAIHAAVVGFAASWLLGCGFYLALVLSSLGRMRIVVMAMAGAVAVGAACIEGLARQPAILVAPLGLCLVLVPVLRRTIGDPARHM